MNAIKSREFNCSHSLTVYDLVVVVVELLLIVDEQLYVIVWFLEVIEFLLNTFLWFRPANNPTINYKQKKKKLFE